MARSGDMGLGGWKVEYCMPMAKTDDADAVVCTGDDAAFQAIMVGEGDDAEAMVTDDGEDNKANLGKATFATVADPSMEPTTIYVRAATAQSAAGGEMWEQSDALMHPHTGLDLPLGADDAKTRPRTAAGDVHDAEADGRRVPRDGRRAGLHQLPEQGGWRRPEAERRGRRGNCRSS